MPDRLRPRSTVSSSFWAFRPPRSDRAGPRPPARRAALPLTKPSSKKARGRNRGLLENVARPEDETMNRRQISRVFSALLLALPTGLLSAQQPPTFTEEVEVRVMDVDVTVTDKSGRPVPDLKREDFTVKVDGKPVPIDYFARVEAGTIHAPDLATASPDQVLAAYRRGDEAFVPRHFLMYVDLGHLAPDGRKRGLEGLRDLIARMGPNDQGRVLMFDRRSKGLTGWTSSKEELFAALTRNENAGVGRSRLLTERRNLRDIDSPRAQ